MSSWAFRTRKTTFTNCNNETLVTTLRCKCIAALYYTKPYLFSFDSLTFKCFAPLYYHSVQRHVCEHARYLIFRFLLVLVIQCVLLLVWISSYLNAHKSQNKLKQDITFTFHHRSCSFSLSLNIYLY